MFLFLSILVFRWNVESFWTEYSTAWTIHTVLFIHRFSPSVAVTAFQSIDVSPLCVCVQILVSFLIRFGCVRVLLCYTFYFSVCAILFHFLSKDFNNRIHRERTEEEEKNNNNNKDTCIESLCAIRNCVI